LLFVLVTPRRRFGGDALNRESTAEVGSLVASVAAIGDKGPLSKAAVAQCRSLT
jgi:hypothetical protein